MQDLGIDLVCTRNDEKLIVQCKRLSVAREIPVRENVVSQTYGAAKFYALQEGLDDSCVIPVIATSYELSSVAKKFANLLGVRVREHVAFEPYPCIKCNISQRDGAKIYHLPFDQQYDRTAIGNRDGEFYAQTVNDARTRGFRRAFRWTGP